MNLKLYVRQNNNDLRLTWAEVKAFFWLSACSFQLRVNKDHFDHWCHSDWFLWEWRVSANTDTLVDLWTRTRYRGLWERVSWCAPCAQCMFVNYFWSTSYWHTWVCVMIRHCQYIYVTITGRFSKYICARWVKESHVVLVARSSCTYVLWRTANWLWITLKKWCHLRRCEGKKVKSHTVLLLPQRSWKKPPAVYFCLLEPIFLGAPFTRMISSSQ